MSVSTDGMVCYGILFEEGYEFPWDDDKYDGDESEWWREVKGYELPFEMYGADGEYIGDKGAWTEKQISDYFAHGREWDKEHPLPFQAVNCCSGDYPIYILAVPDSYHSASRGYPQELSLDTTLPVPGLEELLAFCEQYGLDNESGNEARWWLCSYWG